jgi:hypothetical protein
MNLYAFSHIPRKLSLSLVSAAAVGFALTLGQSKNCRVIFVRRGRFGQIGQTFFCRLGGGGGPRSPSTCCQRPKKLIVFVTLTLRENKLNARPGNTKGESITVPLTSCLNGLD